MLAKTCKNKEKKLHLPLTAWLSYLLVISLLFSGISLAKFTASSSDADSARIATFSVSATENVDQQKQLVLDSAESIGEYKFEVQNDCEVTVKYTVIIKNLPADVNVTLNDSQTVTSSKESNIVEFDAINLGAGSTDTCALKFTALDNAESGIYEGIAVDVKFEQID